MGGVVERENCAIMGCLSCFDLLDEELLIEGTHIWCAAFQKERGFARAQLYRIIPLHTA